MTTRETSPLLGNFDLIAWEFACEAVRLAQPERLLNALDTSRSLQEWAQYLENHPPSPETLAIALMLGLEKYQSELGRKAANAMHAKPGGSREKAQQIRGIWASGKYSSRDLCATQECDYLKMSWSAARRALRNTPDPT